MFICYQWPFLFHFADQRQSMFVCRPKVTRMIHVLADFYGTKKEFTNKKSIFDGTSYADERVRMCLK